MRRRPLPVIPQSLLGILKYWLVTFSFSILIKERLALLQDCRPALLVGTRDRLPVQEETCKSYMSGHRVPIAVENIPLCCLYLAGRQTLGGTMSLAFDVSFASKSKALCGVLDLS